MLRKDSHVSTSHGRDLADKLARGNILQIASVYKGFVRVSGMRRAVYAQQEAVAAHRCRDFQYTMQCMDEPARLPLQI